MTKTTITAPTAEDLRQFTEAYWAAFYATDPVTRDVAQAVMRNAQRLVRLSYQYEKGEKTGALKAGYAEALAKKAREVRVAAYKTLGLEAPSWA
jgi:hypothetical protein